MKGKKTRSRDDRKAIGEVDEPRSRVDVIVSPNHGMSSSSKTLHYTTAFQEVLVALRGDSAPS